MAALLQVALDFVDLSRALKLAHESVAGGADWLEAGTPLIKSEGLSAVRRLRDAFPQHYIVADMKTMDTGRLEMEIAAKAGANAAMVLGAAGDASIRECAEAGRNYGLDVGVDLACVADPAARAAQVEEWGAAFVSVHTPIDEQMLGDISFDRLRRVREAVTIRVAAAGGINCETAPKAVAAGADIVIVGGAITKSADATESTRVIKQAIATGVPAETALYKRVKGRDVRAAFEAASTANISDGTHRMPCLPGIRPVTPAVKMVGQAVTVRTCPGDWSKPVQAIDAAREGDVIVVDAGGVGPAIWGELATRSALQRKLAGVVIDGGIRDTREIRELGFPAFAKLVLSNAGEPKGLGEIGVPIRVAGVLVCPGDWIIGDDDGVLVVPRRAAAEAANRGMNCLETENRIREEIESGNTTLGQVAELLKWDKK